ncbi:MAG: DUF6703 family protein [Nakamurella sp.]
MTASNGRAARASRSSTARPAPFKVRPLPALAIAVVLAIFIAGLVIGGVLGGLMIGLLVLVAAALLALRWTAIDPRIRLFRLGVVVICLAVAITVVVRG